MMKLDAASSLDQDDELALQRLQQVYLFLLQRARQYRAKMMAEGRESSKEVKVLVKDDAVAIDPERPNE